MSEPLVLSTYCPCATGEARTALSVAGRPLWEVAAGSETATSVATFIQRRFQQAYQARPMLRIPNLLALTTRHGSLLAAVGVRNAATERLFLEDYIDDPVDHIIPRPPRPARYRIAEIAHLAGVEAGVSRFLFPALTVWLHERNYEWIAFTGTDHLRNSFQRLGISIVDIAAADPGRLPDRGAGWGRYYDSHPRVMVANVAEGHGVLARSGALRLVQSGAGIASGGCYGRTA